jgi:hypothetical protein
MIEFVVDSSPFHQLSPDGYPPANKRANDWAKVMRAFQDAM